MENNR